LKLVKRPFERAGMFKVRLQTAVLAAELAAYQEERGFLVARRGRAELELVRARGGGLAGSDKYVTGGRRG